MGSRRWATARWLLRPPLLHGGFASADRLSSRRDPLDRCRRDAQYSARASDTERSTILSEALALDLAERSVVSPEWWSRP